METKTYTVVLRHGQRLKLDPNFTNQFPEDRLTEDQIKQIIINTYNSLQSIHENEAIAVEVNDPAAQKIRDNLEKIHELLSECEALSKDTGISFKFGVNRNSSFSWVIPDYEYVPMPRWFSSSDECNNYDNYGWRKNDDNA